MSSGKQKRVADKVIRVQQTAKEFIQLYIARVRQERGDILTESAAIEEIFQRFDDDIWKTAVEYAGKRKNGDSDKKAKARD